MVSDRVGPTADRRSDLMEPIYSNALHPHRSGALGFDHGFDSPFRTFRVIDRSGVTSLLSRRSPLEVFASLFALARRGGAWPAGETPDPLFPCREPLPGALAGSKAESVMSV